MNRAEILDASIGPPYDIPSSSAPGPPSAGVVSSCTSRLLIRPEEGNYNGVLHGGAAGVVFDMLTTIALGPVARPGFWECVTILLPLSLPLFFFLLFFSFMGRGGMLGLGTSSLKRRAYCERTGPPGC